MKNFRSMRTAGAILVIAGLVLVLAGPVMLVRGHPRVALAVMFSGLLIVVLAIVLEATPRD